MDAKPQRLRTASRVRDENAPPANMAQMKTLHHSRTKSTPALSSLLKNPVKTNTQRQRTAFADVSNTVRNGATVQDDMALSEKRNYDAFPAKSTLQPLKELPESNHQSSRQPALLRPAQRPLSAFLLKAAPLAPVNTIASAVPKHVTEPNCDVVDVRKILTRKQTTIFREQLTVTEPELPPLPPVESRSSAHIAPVHQSLEVPREKRAPSIPEEILPTLLPKEDEKHASLPEQEDFSQGLLETIEKTFANADRPQSLNSLEKQLPLPPVAPSRTSSSETIEQVGVGRSNDQDIYLPALETQIPPIGSSIAGLRLPQSAVSEIPEYWDEDEEDEYYDAEGYTTARSIRSRGDNTTGGLTTFLEPRITARVLKELEAARDFIEATRTDEDVEDEAWDTSMVAEYGDDIFEYMRKLEGKMRPNEHYMDNQNEIQWSMRSVLMDWMIQVHTRFGLLPETLFLAVNYIDRFLSCKVVSLGKLQLVGATAVFVAAKYEEINCPSVQEIVYMVDNAYTVDEILKAERFMLSMLQFELGWPGPMSFLRRISKADEYDLDTRTMAKYFLEVMIMDERFVACAPSFASAGAHCLSRLVLDKGDWTLAHIHYSQYTWWQLYDLVAKLVECCQNPRKHHGAVFEKYTEKKYKRCSLTVETKLSRDFKLPAKNSSRESSSSWGRDLWRRF